MKKFSDGVKQLHEADSKTTAEVTALVEKMKKAIQSGKTLELQALECAMVAIDHAQKMTGQLK